ncbi:hypothetical protein PaecuDRAFT_2520 [Paenibacillus curdlanolyticus YK9]|uniref:Uncharacterized protein n=1 Tax=Paenibacillus curdlanolyticus YK9 TaxID=717606 RepID=E0IA31_9BACL|nr:hypothetical protein [Paenibacillus curdlanolyticus]EFM10608.1 hypothetical protein PaecuDRAFT_2520 [Paenibacillus curdlanolyticus YK9]
MGKNSLVLPVLGALAAAIVGGGLWAAIAVWTDYELGLIAWVIGGMAGYAVSYLSGGLATQAHRVIAVIASLIGIVLGKYFLFSYVIYGSINGMFKSEIMTLFRENFSELFQGMDIVFVVLAIVTAWQIPGRVNARREQSVTPQ